MIDDPRKTDLLMAMLKELLPIEANITQYLAGALMQQSPDVAIPKKCNVTGVFYTGDMGGILCGLDIGGAETKNSACGFHNSSSIRSSRSAIARD